MSKTANPATVGVFVIASVILLVIATFLFGSRHFFTHTHLFIIYFDESINGLELGAPVKFKGVEVGHVKEIMIHFEDKVASASIPVIIEINCPTSSCAEGVGFRLYQDDEYKKQIDHGLRATVVYQSYLTGKLFVELDYHPEDTVPIFSNVKSRYREIPTAPSNLEEIWTKAAQVFTQLSKVDFNEIGQNINHITRKLSHELDELDFKELNDVFIIAMETFTNFTSKADKHINPLFNDISVTLKDGRGAFHAVDNAARRVGDVLSEDSQIGSNFNDTIQDVGGAARAIKNLADFLERNPNSLLGGRK